MKVLPKHNHFFIPLLLPIILASLLIVFLYRANILIAMQANWWLIPILIFTCISHTGSIRIYAAEKRLHPLVWLGAIACIQMSLYGLFTAITNTVLTIPVMSYQATFTANSTFYKISTMYGLFPWSLYTIIAVILSYIAHHKKQRGLMSSTIQRLFHNTHTDAIGLSVDYLIRSSTTVVICTSLSMFAIYLSHIATNFLNITLLQGSNIITLLTITLFMSMCLQPLYASVCRQMSVKLPIVVSLLVFTLLLSIIAILLSWLTTTLPAPLNILSHLEGLLPEFFAPKNWQENWGIFSAIWWFGWTPVVAGFIATISKGYTIRSVIGASLWLPLAWTVINPSFSIPTYFAWLGGLVLLLFFWRKPLLTFLMYHVLPDTHPIKQRPHFYYVRSLTFGIIAAWSLYTISGISSLSTVAFLIMAPVVVILLLAIVSFCRDILT